MSPCPSRLPGHGAEPRGAARRSLGPQSRAPTTSSTTRRTGWCRPRTCGEHLRPLRAAAAAGDRSPARLVEPAAGAGAGGRGAARRQERSRPGAHGRRQDRGVDVPGPRRGSSTTSPDGVGALYVAPIKALLNNQADRLGQLHRDGRAAALRLARRHAGPRPAPVPREPAELLMTTPESLEVMLMSPRVDPGQALRRPADRDRRRGPRVRRDRPGRPPDERDRAPGPHLPSMTSSASGCARPWATPRRSSRGCRAPRSGRGAWSTRRASRGAGSSSSSTARGLAELARDAARARAGQEPVLLPVAVHDRGRRRADAARRHRRVRPPQRRVSGGAPARRGALPPRRATPASCAPRRWNSASTSATSIWVCRPTRRDTV